MKYFIILLLATGGFSFGQDIRSIQLFNPKTNDSTPIISLNEKLILRFDDFSNSSTIYRYTLKHYDRNWQDDGLFFTEFANGNKNGLIEKFQYSFNTQQRYTNYELTFPNDKIQPKISGNFEIIVYKDSPNQPLFSKRFCIVENSASLNLNISRITDQKNPQNNQRIEVQATAIGENMTSNLNSISLNVIQNNNWNIIKQNLKPSSTLGNKILFQQMSLSFPGYNEFFYFDNKTMTQPVNMVANYENIDNTHHTYLFPVWAYPLNYQYQPDVNGAFYFRRNDMGIERDAHKEADYSWVYFSLESEPIDDEIFILGMFNNFEPSKENQMHYDTENKKYVAKIYLKQGFYNYILATKDAKGTLDFGKINGNFWQTENLYQALLYYRPFGKNYDALLGYGELRTPTQ